MDAVLDNSLKCYVWLEVPWFCIKPQSRNYEGAMLTFLGSLEFSHCFQI